MRPPREVDPNDCKITGIKLVHDGRTSKAGVQYVALFDCEVRGLGIKGCILVRTEKGGIAVWMPQLNFDKDPPGKPRRSVYIVEDSLRHTILTTARDAYRALGGTEAEWTPRDAD